MTESHRDRHTLTDSAKTKPASHCTAGTHITIHCKTCCDMNLCWKARCQYQKLLTAQLLQMSQRPGNTTLSDTEGMNDTYLAIISWHKQQQQQINRTQWTHNNNRNQLLTGTGVASPTHPAISFKKLHTQKCLDPRFEDCKFVDAWRLILCQCPPPYPGYSC